MNEHEFLIHSLGIDLVQSDGQAKAPARVDSCDVAMLRIGASTRSFVLTHEPVPRSRLVPRTEAEPRRSVPPPPPPAPLVDTPRVPNSFVQMGEFWQITYNGATIYMADRRGLRYLGMLIASPNTDLAALAMYHAAKRSEYLLTASRYGGLDERQLRDDFLTLRDRPAEFTKRSRDAVSKAIRDALRAIEEHHPVLATHLRRAMRFGICCAYEPSSPVEWQTKSTIG